MLGELIWWSIGLIFAAVLIVITVRRAKADHVICFYYTLNAGAAMFCALLLVVIIASCPNLYRLELKFRQSIEEEESDPDNPFANMIGTDEYGNTHKVDMRIGPKYDESDINDMRMKRILIEILAYIELIMLIRKACLITEEGAYFLTSRNPKRIFAIHNENFIYLYKDSDPEKSFWKIVYNPKNENKLKLFMR